MPYRLFGAIHATTYSLLDRLRSERGQGTVEYVAIILLVATIFAAVITAAGDFALAETISDKIKSAINKVSPDTTTAAPKGGKNQ